MYSHTVEDIAAFIKSMQKTIKGDVSLEDAVAIHDADMGDRRQAMSEKMGTLVMVRRLPKLSKLQSRLEFADHPPRFILHQTTRKH